MIKDIKGLHHVTSMASDARQNNRFFTDTLGLRRVKQTVNFDDPSVYHLYYGDETGSAGTVMTYFPFPNMMLGRPGVGEVGETQFSVPKGSLKFWQDRFTTQAWTVWNAILSSARTDSASWDRTATALRLSSPLTTSALHGWQMEFQIMRPSAVSLAHASACTTPLQRRSCSASWATSAPRRRATLYASSYPTATERTRSIYWHCQRLLSRAGCRFGAPYCIRRRQPREAARGAQGADGHWLPGHPRHRPRLFLGHLLPHTGRYPLRGRHKRARIQLRRGYSAPRGSS